MIISLLWNQRRWKKKLKVLRLLNRHTVYPAGGSSLKNRDRAELYGYTVIDPLSVLLMHLSEVIRQHSYELLTRQEVVRLTENLKKQLLNWWKRQYHR